MILNIKSNRSIKLFYLIMIVLISSCAPREEIIYFQDKIATPSDDIIYAPDLIYKTGDMLTIDISGPDPEAIRPFNLPAVSYSGSAISAQGALKMQTYLIKNDGTIEFPVLGTLKLEGLNSIQATEMIKLKLSEYLKNPIVNIRLANFTISVIGEVNKPGTFTIDDERVSLTEAIALAGDLTIYGRRDNVFLIRDINGKKQYKKLDLTSIRILNSPLYYLTQNDVIYVEPNNAKVRQSSFNPNNGVLISAIATLATIVAILIK
ncbi:polysaccharide biosynthesis/export family protein [uncultured Gelidibacter sp.]|uniref:polysaccharide biosynthesis/export family protein n=1 Tax=uncultured Gelidibacter sp. TaxID=259318 RepID=UPI002614A5A2|nr:polysaccharide biosynthesis/export family protein [uncultured Gelidibacter sp.]